MHAAMQHRVASALSGLKNQETDSNFGNRDEGDKDGRVSASFTAPLSSSSTTRQSSAALQLVDITPQPLPLA